MSKPTVEKGAQGRQVRLAAGSDVDDASLLPPSFRSASALPCTTRSLPLTSMMLLCSLHYSALHLALPPPDRCTWVAHRCITSLLLRFSPLLPSPVSLRIP